MPLGDVSTTPAETFYSGNDVQALIEMATLMPTTENTPGPSRYFKMADSDSQVGFISYSHNFCDGRNRVRVTVGPPAACLGNEHR